MGCEGGIDVPARRRPETRACLTAPAGVGERRNGNHVGMGQESDNRTEVTVVTRKATTIRASARALTLFAGAAAVGALVWFAGRFDGPTQHDYWISIGLIAAAGLVFGAVQPRRSAMGGLVVAVLAMAPTLWVVVDAQPLAGETIRSWSQSIGIEGTVRNLVPDVRVLTFATVVLLSMSIAGSVRRRTAAPTPTVQYRDEPLEAELADIVEPEETRTVEHVM